MTDVVVTPSSVLVPVGNWAYGEPRLLVEGKPANLGLLAEALVLFEVVHIHVEAPEQLAAVVEFFKRGNRLHDLATLTSSKTIRFFYPGFVSLPVFDENRGTFMVANLQEENNDPKGSFERSVLDKEVVRRQFPTDFAFHSFAESVLAGLEISDASRFGSRVSRAVDPLKSAEMAGFVVQVIVDEVREGLAEDVPLLIEASVVANERGESSVVSLTLLYSG